MPVSDKKRASNKKWDEANVDRMSIVAPKGTRDEIKAAAVATGESANAYIIGAIRARMFAGNPAPVPTPVSAPAASPAPAIAAPEVSADALEFAAAAAAAAGEDVPAFIARAIRQTADADERARRYAQAAPVRSAPRETVPAERLEDQIQQRVQRLKQVHEERGHRDRDERGTCDPADATAADKKAAQDAPKAP